MNDMGSIVQYRVNRGDMCGLIKVLRRGNVLIQRHEEDRGNDRPQVAKRNLINHDEACRAKQKKVWRNILSQ